MSNTHSKRNKGGVKWGDKEGERKNEGRRGKLKKEAISCEDRNSTRMTFTSVAKNPSGPLHIQQHTHAQIHPCLLRFFKLYIFKFT